MIRVLSIIITICIASISLNAKTLVVYYSYTNNVKSIVNALSSQIECDVVEIEPAQKGLDYAADNYAIGSAQIAAIRDNPNDAASYPAIDPVNVNLDEYDTVIIGAPLWWSQMAAPLQTFLFNNAEKMVGKNICLIVSSHSSGISGVVADAKRLIPDGNFIDPALWIRSSQTSNAASLITAWLNDIHYSDLASVTISTTQGNEIEIVAENGKLSVNGDCNTLTLYNMTGHKVMQTADNQVCISSLAPGIYIAQAGRGNRSATRKVSIR